MAESQRSTQNLATIGGIMTEPTPDESSSTDLDETTLDPRTRAALQKARNEAKNLRTRLHAAEADVQKLISQNAAMQHREIERIAGEHLIDPQDIWRAESQEFTDSEFNEIIGDRVREA